MTTSPIASSARLRDVGRRRHLRRARRRQQPRSDRRGAARAGLPFVLTATETGGAIAAIAQAEITGRPGACLTTLGPGVASVVNGVACAWLDRAPLLVFTDSHPARRAACIASAARSSRAASRRSRNGRSSSRPRTPKRRSSRRSHGATTRAGGAGASRLSGRRAVGRRGR